MTNLITARSPAAFAEEYILESIWNGKFAAGTILPAERELSEQIGVTRTTLREVLQRVARDGWLTIAHGKPTKVNDIWETAGLHTLATIWRLDIDKSDQLAQQIFQVKLQLSELYYLSAIKVNKLKLIELFGWIESLEDSVEAYTEFDWLLQKQSVKLSTNPVFNLLLNGFENSYQRLGRICFSIAEFRLLTKKYYLSLQSLLKENETSKIPLEIKSYCGNCMQLLNNKLNVCVL